MAFAITSPTTPNISDTQASLSVSWSGANIGTGWYVNLYLRINGTTVSSWSGTATATGTKTLAVSSVVQAIYNAAAGSPRAGAVSVYAENFYDDYPPVLVSDTKTGGTLTINYRIQNLSMTKPVSAGAWNMDLTTGNNISASWTRTNSAAFYARLKGYVWNGSSWVLVMNRYGFANSTGIDMDAYGYHDAIVNAMGGVSPRDFRLQIITQFNDGTADYEDLSYTATEGTTQRTSTLGSITKTFVILSTIAINNFTLSDATTTVPFTLTKYGSYTHTVRLYVKVGATDYLVRTETGITASGNFTIGATERNIILDAMPNLEVASTWAAVDTASYGTTDSKSVATTVSLDAAYKPSFGTISWAESAATTYVKTALGYTLQADAVFLTNKSKVVFTVPTIMARGATLSNIRVVFAGTTTDSATSPITTGFLITAGATSSYTITATDSRNRSIVLTNGSIKVRAYTYPTRNKFEIFRTTGGTSTTYDPLGTFLRAIYAATAYSVLNAAGVEKNWVRLRIDTKLSTDPDANYVNKLSTSGTSLSVAETGSNYSGFLAANAYSVRIRVYDAFYDLDNDGSALEDTDDYSENIQTLPIGKVALDIGIDNVGIGKLWAQGTLDVGGDIYSSGKLTVSSINTSDTLLRFATDRPWKFVQDGDDAFTSLTLQPESDIKNFYIKSTDGTKNIEFRPYNAGAEIRVQGSTVWHAGNLIYENGTFTPTVIGTTVAGTYTYSARLGYYTRIGSMCHFQLYVQVSASSGATGYFQITGLPFNSTIHTALSVAFLDTFTRNYDMLTCRTTTGQSFLTFESYIATGGGAQVAAKTGAFGIMVAGSYRIA